MQDDIEIEKVNAAVDVVGSEARPIDRRLVLPKSLANSSLFDIWGDGGPGRLLSRLASEHKAGGYVAEPLTPAEIAILIELFKDEQLPDMLRDAVVRELRGERRVRSGPKGVRTIQEQMEYDLLSSVHERGLRVAERLRRLLRHTEAKKKRREKAAVIPTRGKIAVDYVKKWLPSMRMRSSKTINNLISEQKSDDDKKPRAKRVTR